jgi:hypothetical protein
MKMMNILDVYDRALKGPIMSENEFNMKVYIPHIRRVIKEYNIIYDRENPVLSDDQLADRIYEAAVDFMAQVGVYCVDTSRIMQFSKEEVLEAAKEARGKCYVGEGKEAQIFEIRRPDDPKVPWLHVGSGIVSSTEENATNIVEGYASIAKVNSVNIPALASIRGIQVSAGAPTEFYATIRALRIGLEALRRAGRPGLPIMNHHPTPAVAVNNIAASAPQYGSRPTDGWLCGTIAEMKVNHDTLNKVAYLKAWGANVGAEAGAMLGGYCGGPEGFAIQSTAYLLMGQLVLKGDYHLNYPFHFKYTCSSTRDVLWGSSIAVQATSRNIPVPTIWASYCAAGPNTSMYFYETAAILLAWTTSGAPSVMSPHPAKAVKTDGITPMEAKFAVEMGIAASRLTREKVNDIVIRLLENYEARIETAPSGSRYQDCHDPVTGKPGEDYVRLYDEIKNELAGMGIPFD